ncbi:MAG: hypothetical protein H7A24_15420 [Leptospiraceae bacterium]|nr:hypothetical protein [Leptospiraceae bacterium]MCP5513276.1 hypothetical protein [Leptospiraceae bacterium]
MSLIKLLLPVLILSFAGCKKGSEVLAKFDGGEILRQDLQDIYEIENIPRDEKTTSIQTQSGIIEQLAIQSMMELEGTKNGLFEREDVKNLMFLSEKQITVNLIRKNLINKLKDSKGLELVSLQLIMKSVPGKEAADALLEEVKKLSGDDKIEEFFSAQTDEKGRKCLGGHLEPQCANCVGNEQLIEIFQEGISAKDNNFYLTFLENRAFIYRITKTKEVKADKVESYISDVLKDFNRRAIEYTNKNQGTEEKEEAQYYLEDGDRLKEKAKMTANQYINGFESKLWQDEVVKQMEDPKNSIAEEAKVHPSMLPDTLPEDLVLFKNEKTSYIYKNLIDDFNKIPNLPKNQITARERVKFFQSVILNSLLFENSEISSDIRTSSNFKNAQKFMRRNIAFSFFKKDIESKDFDITEEDLKATYEAGKQFSYSEASPTNPNERKPIPFETVKSRIRQEIISQRASSEIQAKMKDLKTQYHMEIFTDKLKAGEI